MHLMHGDGVVYESHLCNALNHLYREVSTGDPHRFVDVVILALGYHVENANDAAFTGVLGKALARLGQCGVLVVASAGNDATSRPTYPAALAAAAKRPLTPLVSVGSLNPNGVRATYSNTATWVTDWDRGTGVVSTLPPFNGSLSPALSVPAKVAGVARASLDPDDFTGRFARWTGTSFAAAVFAARVTQKIISVAGKDALLATDPTSASQRVEAALAACRS